MAENKKPQDAPPPPPASKDLPPPRSSSIIYLLLIMGVVFGFVYLTSDHTKRSKISYGMFRQQLDAGNVTAVTIQGAMVEGDFKIPPPDTAAKHPPDHPPPKMEPKFITTLPPLVDHELDDVLRDKLGVNYGATEPTDTTFTVLAVYLLVTIGLFAAVWYMFRRARDSFLGGTLMSGFAKSGARRYESGNGRVTFEDVAGLEGVKNELQEIVEFLKNPEKFQRLGGRVPKGVLLMGPPGTGKTLLGRAVAGEAGVPFFSINGSEFIQMFVGVGAGRVRDLFSTAKESAPAILFIDEIDAVGRLRGTGVGGGHDEREQTLNQILSEMDGFSQNESVIVMAATNRPDVLDPALLRPGRFDRHITVDRPNYKGRLAIFRVHSRNVPLEKDVDLERMAAGTVGLTGADIRNLVNEAAIWASRHNKDGVAMADFEYARDKVLMGTKREEVLTGKEKSMTAFHEAGHALLAWSMAGMDRLHKVSIIPHGRALGATQLLPEEDRVNISESELHTRLVFMLGGRVAEKLAYDEFTAGSEDDLKKATQLARRMVAHWGMSDRLGPVAFRSSEEHPFLGREMAEPREFSEATARIIDEEVVRILREASDRAERLLREHRDKLDILANALEQEETLDERDVTALIGPSAPSQRVAAG